MKPFQKAALFCPSRYLTSQMEKAFKASPEAIFSFHSRFLYPELRRYRYPPKASHPGKDRFQVGEGISESGLTGLEQRVSKASTSHASTRSRFRMSSICCFPYFIVRTLFRSFSSFFGGVKWACLVVEIISHLSKWSNGKWITARLVSRYLRCSTKRLSKCSFLAPRRPSGSTRSNGEARMKTGNNAGWASLA